MKACTALILVCLIVTVSIVVSPADALGEPVPGVKKGDWIEYNISMTGPTLNPLRNLTWYRIDVLEVDGASFQVNKTALSVDGTLSSSIWNFNLTEGKVQGWVIIPANLGAGEAFFDAAKSAIITIAGEEQKTLLGANRTVTHASDPGKVYKEWDKATGVYIYTIDHTTDYTFTANAIATNMWSPQTLKQNQTNFCQLAAAIVVLALLMLLSAVFIARRKLFTGLVLVSLIVSVSMIAPFALVYGEPSVGVKEGDWIEYNISVTGKGSLPPTHDVRWMRIEVLPIQGTAFSINLTSRYANGTIGSAIWKFNFTEGNVGGWIIIPSNLSPGDTFYDSSIHTGIPVNVTIQRQEQKILLGASRTVTYGNDSLRHKEWDKATGVFVGASEVLKNVTTKAGLYIEDLTVTTQAIATNMWNPQILGLDQTMFYALVAASAVLAVLIVPSAMFIARRKRLRKFTLRHPSQAKIAALTIIVVVLLQVAFMFTFPFYAIGLSFAEINLILQTVLTGLVLVSMWFRMKGNYFVHEIIMLVVMCVLLVGFSTVLLMDPMSGSSSQVFSSSPLRLVMNSLHAIFSIPAMVFGVWLVALWRPGSTTFAAKSKRIAQLTTVFWVPSYVVGVLDFLILHTTFFG